MDSRASTSLAQRPKPLTINTTNHAAMVSSKPLAQSPSSAYLAFRPSPLNPSSSPSPSPTDKSVCHQRRSATFPASRPLRPFPSIAQSLNSAKPRLSGNEMLMGHDSGVTSSKPRDDSAVPGGKKSPKTIEISSKWQGGFFVIGMTQAEFSRRD